MELSSVGDTHRRNLAAQSTTIESDLSVADSGVVPSSGKCGSATFGWVQESQTRTAIASDDAALLALREWGGSRLSGISHLAKAVGEFARNRLSTRRIISSSEAVLALVAREMIALERETVRALFLNPKNHLLAYETVAEGSVNRVDIYPREVIRRALQHNATALVLVHNHPSGDPFPSEADLKMTRSFHSVCKGLDLVLHDHIIIGIDGWFSFMENKLI